MKIPKAGDWWLKLLALVLAIAIYLMIKDGSVRPETHHHDRHFFQQR